MHLDLKRILPMLALAWAGTGEAATYYVRNGGNDSADGRSHATAWASLNKVNNFAFAAADAVLLHEGDRFVGKVTVDWAGNSSARSVLGAYYFDEDTDERATVPLAFPPSPPVISSLLAGGPGSRDLQFSDLETRSLAAFGELSVEVVDGLELSGGLLHEQERIAHDAFLPAFCEEIETWGAGFGERVRAGGCHN